MHANAFQDRCVVFCCCSGLIFTYHILTNINKQWQHSSNSSISTAICRHMIISDGIEVYKCAPRIFICVMVFQLFTRWAIYIYLYILHIVMNRQKPASSHMRSYVFVFILHVGSCAVKECISLVAALVCLENLESFAHGYYPLAQTATKKTRENRRDIERN